MIFAFTLKRSPKDALIHKHRPVPADYIKKKNFSINVCENKDSAKLFIETTTIESKKRTK